MITIVICSINPSLLKQVSCKIAATIRCEYETIAFDNREERKPLQKFIIKEYGKLNILL